MLTLTKTDDVTVTVSRAFRATPQQVWDAHIDPALIRQWMLGPDGWQMTVCEHEGIEGGTMHLVWANAEGASFSLTGETVEVQAPHRMVHIERMHLPDPTPDNHVETLIEATPEGCVLTLIMTLPDQQTRDIMLDTGMADGMEASYARLEGLL